MATGEPAAQESSNSQRSKENANACPRKEDLRESVAAADANATTTATIMPANAELSHERLQHRPILLPTEQPLDFSISRRNLTPTPPSPPSPVHPHNQHLDVQALRVTRTGTPSPIEASSPAARSPTPPTSQQQQQRHPPQQPHSIPPSSYSQHSTSHLYQHGYREDRYHNTSVGDTTATSTTSEPEPIRVPPHVAASMASSQGYRGGPGSFGTFGFNLGSVGVTAGMIAMNEAFNQSNFFSSLPPLSLSMLQQAQTNSNNNHINNGNDNGRKPPKAVRPFKAYPRDPLSLPIGYYGMSGHYGMPVDGVVPSNLLMNDSYADYRRQMLLGQHNKDFPSSMVPSSNMSHSGGDALKAINRCPPSSPAISSDNSLSPAPPMSTTTTTNNNNATGPPPGLLPSPLPLLPPPSSLSVRSNSPTLSSSSPGLTPDTPNSNSSSKRRQRSLPDDLKDEAYWERRRKNNEAAKRSRDARRAKEDEIAIRAAYLEQENLKLRVEVAALKNETAKLRCLLYNS